MYWNSSFPRDINFKLDSTNLILKFRNNQNFGFNLENFNFELLIQKLRPQMILKLVTALLLERKVILIKTHFEDISIIMQSLISLMNPFNWHHTIITYLTEEMIDFVDAPVPYLIGVSAKAWDKLWNVREYPSDIVIFDLENQLRWFTPEWTDLPDLPVTLEKELII